MQQIFIIIITDKMDNQKLAIISSQIILSYLDFNENYLQVILYKYSPFFFLFFVCDYFQYLVLHIEEYIHCRFVKKKRSSIIFWGCVIFLIGICGILNNYSRCLQWIYVIHNAGVEPCGCLLLWVHFNYVINIVGSTPPPLHVHPYKYPQSNMHWYLMDINAYL